MNGAGGADDRSVREDESAGIASLLRQRRSTKSYRQKSVDAADLEDIVATTFARDSRGQRAYGSAHARYGIVVTVVAGSVAGLAQGAYRFRSEDRLFDQLSARDHRPDLAANTLDAPWVVDCSAVLVLSTDLEAANGHFAEQGARRGEGFSWLETGLIAQTVQLCAAEKGLGTVVLGGLVGADSSAHSWLPDSHTILALMPLGHPA